MDDYPALSLDHNLPLLVALGVANGGSENVSVEDTELQNGVLAIRSDLPALETPHASAVLRCFQARDGSALPWGGRENTKRYHFRIQAAGRTLFLPPRRARLPQGYDVPQSGAVLHSPFSPLSPTSALYPNGLIDARWLRKHQVLIPSILLCFYELTTSPNLATLHDNQIKSDIASIRTALSQSGYKTKLAVVILGDHSAHSVEGIQERVDSIRKGSGLDSKACFLVPPQESQEELDRIVENTLTTLYSQAIDYYRDLGRHARKKRNRGFVPQPTVPPTTGTSQTLSLSGWNVRYDFKSAVFAEFRQEMDTALRSFEQAYENLLSAEVLDMIPSWSPRWNEARLLADVISVRSIRCQLWSGHHSAAVRRWQAHRARISDFVERRGRGTQNYGWEAWEARWAVVMANMISRSDIPEFAPPRAAIYLQPEKAVMGERLQPWEWLHHPGYWYRLAADHLYARRTFAYAMPEDDRRPPGSSPASKVAGRAFTYDTFLCPEPHDEWPLNGAGVNHSRLILDCLMKARAEFEKWKQPRQSAELALECAQELAASQDWENVLTVLSPLWEGTLIRGEGWMDIAESFGWTLRSAAVQTKQAELVLAIDWELLERHYTRTPNWHYDITKSLDGMSTETKVFVRTSDALGSQLVRVSFVFRGEEGKAGSSVPAQLTIRSNAMIGSAPIVLSALHTLFTGSLKPVRLTHHAASEGDANRHQQPVVTRTVALREGSVPSEPSEDPPLEADGAQSLVGSTDLTLFPGQTLVFNLDIPLREPGNSGAVSAKLQLHNDKFELEHSVNLQNGAGSTTWFLSPTSKIQVARSNSHSIKILPRPPKLEIRALNLLEEFYTNEAIELELAIVNAEDVEASGKVDIILFGEEAPVFDVAIDGREGGRATRQEDDSSVLALSLDNIGSGDTIKGKLDLGSIQRSTRYDLTIKMAYHLSTDLATPILQTAVFQINVINPFEANYDLLPRLHPDSWPSLFDYDGIVDPSDEDSLNRFRGLAQTWCLVTRYASFASEDLKVVDVDIHVKESSGLRCTTSKLRPTADDGLLIRPKTITEASFEITAQKRSLDDRGPALLDTTFIVKWSRTGAQSAASSPSSPQVNTTVLPVPPFTILGSEPRVLAATTLSLHPSPTPGSSPPKSKDPQATATTESDPNADAIADADATGPPLNMIHLRIVIENPSAHFLTFGLAMEPSDDFAFSGPKKTTLHLLPLSRRHVVYRLLPLVHDDDAASGDGDADGDGDGVWIRPLLTVRDKYFQKVLRVMPTQGMRADKEGFLVWVPPRRDGVRREEQGSVQG